MALVNSWTEFGTLEEVVVGRADNTCFPLLEPNFVPPTINDETIAEYFSWPEGRKKKEIIDRANKQLEGLVEVMEGEGIIVKRPAPVDHYVETKTPSWSSKSQFGTVCPRDCLITLGDIVLETTMSTRSRLFEYLPYRHIVRDLWKRDRNMKWKAMPKPSFDDDCYDTSFWERERKVGETKFTLTEKEPFMEAADISRCGKDIFIQPSLVTNDAGIEWLKREIGDKLRVHIMRFPNDLYPVHIDATFTTLAPGIALTNPEHPPDKESSKIWLDNDWKFLVAPQPVDPIPPPFSFCSKWLCMNILSISPTKVIIEEIPTATVLNGPDLYVDKGSTINLTCAIQFSPEPPVSMFWYHQDK
ncbi:Glycine amidinotransferase, mitochondrial, partial [Pseudolycoriella hygida]